MDNKKITLVSTNVAGEISNGGHFNSSFSPDGKSIMFSSGSSNLVAGDNNGQGDVFIKDLQTGAVTLVSKTMSGTLGNGGSTLATFSPDGTKVAFASNANNFFIDNNNARDVFVKDLITGALNIVSISAANESGNAFSTQPVFSADGKNVIFASFATNLVPTINQRSYYSKNLDTGEIYRIAKNTTLMADGIKPGFAVSGDGLKIAYASLEPNLVDGDTDNRRDLFVEDVTTGHITRIPMAEPRGLLSNFSPVFSSDGKKLAFETDNDYLSSDDGDDKRDVYVMDLASGALTLMPSSDGRLSYSLVPSFSSDSSKLAYASSGDIYIQDLNSDITVRLFQDYLGIPGQRPYEYDGPANISEVSFSPDGSKILFSGNWVVAVDYLGRSIFNQTNSHVYMIDLKDLIIGTKDDNVLRGNAADNSIFGGIGHDTLWGHDGNDRLFGGEGEDRIYAGDGNDILNGGAGSDGLYGENGDDEIHGGDGHDVISGGLGDDYIYGDDGYDQIFGKEGSDYIFGGSGNDLIVGGDGSDQLLGGDDNDALWGGGDNDFISAGDGSDLVFGDGGNDTLFGDAGNDIINGGAGNDELSGDGDSDQLYGGSGADRLYGGAGDDIIYGEGSGDKIFGGEGDDLICGGAGGNTIYGNSGADRFVFDVTAFDGYVDKIMDFRSAEGDTIELKSILSGYVGVGEIDSYLHQSVSVQGLVLSVDRDGASDTYQFQDIAILKGVSQMNFADAISNETIVV